MLLKGTRYSSDTLSPSALGCAKAQVVRRRRLTSADEGGFIARCALSRMRLSFGISS